VLEEKFHQLYSSGEKGWVPELAGKGGKEIPNLKRGKGPISEEVVGKEELGSGHVFRKRKGHIRLGSGT